LGDTGITELFVNGLQQKSGHTRRGRFRICSEKKVPRRLEWTSMPRLDGSDFHQNGFASASASACVSVERTGPQVSSVEALEIGSSYRWSLRTRERLRWRVRIRFDGRRGHSPRWEITHAERRGAEKKLFIPHIPTHRHLPLAYTFCAGPRMMAIHVASSSHDAVRTCSYPPRNCSHMR
jgi:hypothetical protein